ncbi:MAG: hypothetical protein RLZZ142_201, partial [Verrucomicrobiota bacterium]
SKQATPIPILIDPSSTAKRNARRN